MGLLFVYGVVGCELFGRYEHDSETATVFEDEVGSPLRTYFGTLPRSIATMMQAMTLDGWMSGLMRPLANTRPAAWPFLISCVVVVS